MYKPNDPKIIENTKKRREWEAANPNRDWKTNLTQAEINDLADDMGEPEAKKPTNHLVDWLVESEQIK